MSILAPNFAAEHAAVDDLLEKGEISDVEAKAQHDKIRRDSMEYVIALKGGRHGVKKKKKGHKSEITTQREQFLAQKRREFAEQILAEGLPEVPDIGNDEPEAVAPVVNFSMPLSSQVLLAETSPPPES